LKTVSWKVGGWLLIGSRSFSACVVHGGDEIDDWVNVPNQIDMQDEAFAQASEHSERRAKD
jgi:hypothetical protein